MTTDSFPERELDDPVIDASNEAFWQATREGRLMVKRCTACAQPHWYPRALCPFCMGETEWVDVSGRGTVYSASTIRTAGPVPYTLAYVRLEEGVTLLTNIVGCAPGSVRIGDAVKLVFRHSPDGSAVPLFTPA